MGAILNWSNILANTGLVATFADEESLEIGLNNLVLPPLFSIAAKGAKFIMVGLDGSIRSPEAQDAIDRWTNPTAAMEDALAVFVDAEVANGNWGTNASNYTDAEYDAFWLFGGVNSDVNALTDLHQVNKLTAVNNGATRVANGWDYDGTSDRTETGFIPSTLGVNFTAIDRMQHMFCKTNGDTVPTAIRVSCGWGGSSADEDRLQNRTTPDFRYNVSGASGNADATETTYGNDGLYSMGLEDVGSGNSQRRVFKDGVVLFSPGGAFANAGVPTFQGAVGANQTTATTGASNFDGIVSAYAVTSFTGFDKPGFNTNLRNMLTSLGVL